MKKILIAFYLFLYSFALSQDVYPYFNDSNKQFKFEERKIFTEISDNKEMIISGGGDRFNIFSLVLPDEPIYKKSDIVTRYRYISDFSIYQGNQPINEIEFCSIIGLTDVAKEIQNNYLEKLQNYEIQNAKLNKPNHSNLLYKGVGFISLLGGGFLGLTGLVFIDQSPPASLFITSGVLLYFGWKIFKKGDYVHIEIPVMERRFSNQQIISLAESYNRNLYKEIQSQP